MPPRKPTPPMPRSRRQDVEPAAPARSLTLLTVRDAAAYARVSEQTIRRWITAGLKIYRAGRQIRTDEQDLMGFISAWPIACCDYLLVVLAGNTPRELSQFESCASVCFTITSGGCHNRHA